MHTFHGESFSQPHLSRCDCTKSNKEPHFPRWKVSTSFSLHRTGSAVVSALRKGNTRTFPTAFAQRRREYPHMCSPTPGRDESRGYARGTNTFVSQRVSHPRFPAHRGSGGCFNIHTFIVETFARGPQLTMTVIVASFLMKLWRLIFRDATIHRPLMVIKRMNILITDESISNKIGSWFFKVKAGVCKCFCFH